MNRVTNSMMNQIFLSDMHNNLERMLKLQRQMSTGKLHQRPSDDPLAVGRELSISTTIFENEQYLKNLDDAMMWLSNTDAALNQIGDVMQRIRELVIYAGNGTFKEAEYNAIADEVYQLQEELVNTANFSVEGRYLFSGLNSTQKAFQRDPSTGKIVYMGNERHVEYEVERQVTGQVSFHGREVFPIRYQQYTLASYEVPLSFSWTGRSEILQIKVGDRTAKVQIPEKWSDDDKDGVPDLSDGNNFRDSGELGGYTLDELASLINESLSMGDVGKLVSVSVEKDYDRGVQKLVIKGHTGEPLSVTSWPSADFEPLPSDETVKKPTDHSHIGLASYLGIETSLKSVEFSLSDTIDPASDPIYWRLESGDNFAEVRIDSGSPLSIQDLADRLNSAAGDWLQVIVQADEEEASLGADFEAPTQKLVFRTLDGSALNIYDLKPTVSTSAADFGLQTALVMDDTNAIFPLDGLDPNMPALVNVEVGGQSYTVKLYRDQVATLSGSTWNVDASKVAKAIQSQVGADLIGYRELEDGRVTLYSKTGQSLKVTDLPFGDPHFADYTSGIAANLGIHSGLKGGEIAAGSVPLSDGVIRIASGGHTVDVSVLQTDTAEDIAKKIKGLAGSWLDVSLYDADLSGSSGSQRISLAAKDGSPLAVYDVQGDVANSFLQIDTALRSTSNVLGWTGSGPLSITVNGYTHTIDTAGMDINDLVNTVNARFQSGDVRAEIVEDSPGDMRLVLWSPKGYVVQAQGDTPALPGSPSPMRGGVGPYNQVTTVRTSADINSTDFFGLLDDLIQAVKQGDAEGISKSILPKIDQAMDDIFRVRTQAGALVKRYETSSSRLKQMNLNYNELYSKVSDTDLAEAATKFAMAQSVYQASLATIARIIQPTLVDFLT